MNGWNKLLVLLDSLFGFPNKAASKVKKVQQAFESGSTTRNHKHPIQSWQGPARIGRWH